jgi:hypothetical protein
VAADSSLSPRVREQPPVPPTLTVAGTLTLIEGLGILVVTGWLVVGILRERPAEAMTAWGAAGLLGLFGAGVVFAGRGVLRAARWSRAPAAVTQLLLIAVSSQLPWVAVVAVLVVLAVVTGVLLFLPPSTAAFVSASAHRRDADEHADTTIQAPGAPGRDG